MRPCKTAGAGCPADSCSALSLHGRWCGRVLTCRGLLQGALITHDLYGKALQRFGRLCLLAEGGLEESGTWQELQAMDRENHFKIVTGKVSRR